jgi:O-antigen ligase
VHPSDPRPGCLAAEACALGLFACVPLAAFPGLAEAFTPAKWAVLAALAAAWLLVELWLCGSRGWPAFVRERWPAVLLAGGLVASSSLRSGVAWGLPALADRLTFLSLTLAAFWTFRRNGGSTRSIVLGAGVAAGLVAAWGLAQALGLDPLPHLAGGDPLSASFGNVNLAAQFLGLAVLLLRAGDGGSGRGLFVRQAIVVAAFVLLYFLACRSVFLGLAAGLAVLVANGRVGAASVAKRFAVAALLVLALLLFGPPDLRHPLKARVLAEKGWSTEMRLEVWSGTSSLIRDHPLGVGSSSFGDAFIPYQLGVRTIPGETLLFRTPHNEVLRVLAEEGLVFGAVAAFLLASLVRRLWAGRRSGEGSEGRALLGAGGAFLAVEALFQFPFGTPFGCLAAAVLLGLALAALEPLPPAATAGDGRRDRWPWRIGGTLVAATVLVVGARVAASELLFARRGGDAAALERACGLNPRHLPACVTAAWRRANAGERREAERLLHETLARSPYYHPAIRVRADLAFATGDRETGCFYLWIYDQLFRGRTAAHVEVERRCGRGRPASLPQDVPMPFYGTLPVPRASVGGRGVAGDDGRR